ncbi:MAG: ComEA family DNA-binding protein, partial [Candidatus Tectimicrobiota bacterium]
IERQDTMWQAPWATQASTFHDHKLGPGVFHIGYRDSTSMWRHGLQDEEARLNVNNAPVSALAALPGLSPEQAQAIVTARQLTRWNAPEELVQRGFITQERWSGTADSPGLEHDLTVWGSGKVNVNTASPVVLATLPGSTPALVAALIRYRQGPDQQLGTTDDQSFRTLHDVARAPGIDPKALERIRPLLTVTPSAFRFIATGYIARQGVQAHIHRRFAVLERTPQATALRYWRRVE